MKPQSIKLFDYFYLGSIFLGFLAFVSAYGSIASTSAILLTANLVSVAIGLLLWYLVSRRRSTIAKWIIVVLFLLSLISVGGYFAGSMPLYEIYGLLSLVAHAVAVGLLFRGDAIRWLESDPAEDAPDTED